MLFISMRKIVIQPINDTIEGLEDIAQGEGDLTRRLDDRRQDEVGRLSGGFNRFLEKLASMIREIGSLFLKEKDILL